MSLPLFAHLKVLLPRREALDSHTIWNTFWGADHCDNASFHESLHVKKYLGARNDRIQIYFLPAYSPKTNPIERVWWHLHETITRNNRCTTMEELASLACEWRTSNNNQYADMLNTFALAA
jgi:hypothetical protein